MLVLGIPPPLLTDSYKTTHFHLYPEAQKMVAYGEFRAGFNKDTNDSRMVFYGMRYIIENYVAVKWTREDVEMAEQFFKTHNAGFTEFPFPKDLFLKFVDENDGGFPVRIDALPEGTVVFPHLPVYQITAENEYARLVTYLETVLTMIWYPSTVATLSRRSRDLIEAAYEKSVDEKGYWTLDSRLHDFGFRGCTSVEQSIIGGCAHLLNFEGTDTMSAAFYAQFKLNNGRAVATSIPATEHSVMTSYPTEVEAMSVLLERYGSGVCACVMDSYDYVEALETVLPAIAKLKCKKGGFLVLRPDSGDPVEVVLQGLRAIDKVFGSDLNAKGYKVVRGASVIQGDAVTYDSLGKMLAAVLDAGFAAQTVGFGMGGGLLQKVNRDTMSFATKLSKVVNKDGSEREVMKMPKTGADKFSLPGEFHIVRNSQSIPIVYPSPPPLPLSSTPSLLQTVYDHNRPLPTKWDDFTTVRERVKREWTAVPKAVDVLSPELRARIEVFKESRAGTPVHKVNGV
ncbi:nicotinate phosphoribosyltransferase family-domain-containing protein [Fimicolochytrium jonesii]|uniref:nicotinate phosphoribosyltransferase family-domain-containing protein n=1 Tax=Fimicolochytrium jonesii TaxID=1396493 RepID=UPI0022FF0B81|nr:nicotinate phosphoribosyltransferase family-domain-containing protein [Fimicolochytrium jonesii]KAI8816390.1 nicotinate phosphoribosyltransferase family-domain-containing protein [Fimicolochytrium jonesii]